MQVVKIQNVFRRRKCIICLSSQSRGIQRSETYGQGRHTALVICNRHVATIVVSNGPAVVINQIDQNSGLRVFIKDLLLVQFVYNSLRADIKKSRFGRGLVDSFVKGS